MIALDVLFVMTGGHDIGESLFNDHRVLFLGHLRILTCFLLLPNSSISIFHQKPIDPRHIFLGMSDYRNTPASQNQAPPPRSEFANSYLPVHDSDKGNVDEQRRAIYQAARSTAQSTAHSTTFQSHRHDLSKDPTPLAGQHSMPQDGIYGPRPPRNVGQEAEIRVKGTD
jgi:hypothetical protein